MEPIIRYAQMSLSLDPILTPFMTHYGLSLVKLCSIPIFSLSLTLIINNTPLTEKHSLILDKVSQFPKLHNSI